jgi:hypothetical protein
MKIMNAKICGNGYAKMAHLAKAQSAGDQQRRSNRETQRQFVADHLRGTAQTAKQAVLVVRRPSAQGYPVDAHRAVGEDHQNADVEVGHLHRRGVSEKCD